jgi:hypothetical protein
MKKIAVLGCLFLICFILSARVYKTLHTDAGGLLSSLLTSTETKTLTNLSLSGFLDARDFKFLRDSMMVLDSLDIKEVRIVAYKGSQGPAATSVVTYPADEIPMYAYNNEAAKDYNPIRYILLPNSIKTIGKSAFEWTLIGGNLVIPDSVHYIGNNAFHYCDELTGISLPNALKLIGDSAFHNCNRIQSLNTNAVRSIGSYAFSGTGQLSLVMGDSLEYITDHAFYSSNFTGDLNIGKSVKSIGDYVFFGCQGINGIVAIGNSVKSIGSYAFAFSQKFYKLDLGNSVSYIGPYAFWQCVELSGTVTFPTTMTSIEPHAFDACINITHLIFPSSLKSIGTSAFQSCTSLYPNLDIGDSVQVIGKNAFNGAGTYAVILRLPSSLDSIGPNAFKSWTRLLQLEVYKDVPIDLSRSTDVFNGVRRDACHLYIPFGTKKAYQKTAVWNEFTTVYENPMALNTESTQELEITPNPVHDVFRIKGMVGTSILDVVDMNGRLMFSKSIDEGEVVSMRSLRNGVYLAKIKGTLGTTILKVSKR